MLKVTALEKSFQTRTRGVMAVRGVSFVIKEGEFFTLLGPSGCGKTTTLQCVAGLETPDAGKIEMDQVVVFSGRPWVNVPANKRDIGMVFQSYAIWPHMTVFENVAFPLRYGRRRLKGSEVSERVMKVLDLVQLTGFENRPAPLLSGGQQQRVALARALVGEPKLLLLDEPLSNLDAKLRDDMRADLQLLVKRLHTTTLYVTHDQVEALSMSDRIAAMRDGLIVQEGSPREIYTEPRDAFVADFIGKANFIPGRVLSVSADGFADVKTDQGTFSVRSRGGVEVGDEALLAARPDAIRVDPTSSASSEKNSIPGVIELTSFIGERLHCVVRVGGITLRASASPSLEFAIGQAVAITLPADRCMLVPMGPRPHAHGTPASSPQAPLPGAR